MLFQFSFFNTYFLLCSFHEVSKLIRSHGKDAEQLSLMGPFGAARPSRAAMEGHVALCAFSIAMSSSSVTPFPLWPTPESRDSGTEPHTQENFKQVTARGCSHHFYYPKQDRPRSEQERAVQCRRRKQLSRYRTRWLCL